MAGRRLDGYAAATVNRRLVAVSGLFAFRTMRDPSLPSPVPKGREAGRFVPGEKTGLLAHLVRKRRPRSALRLREPRRLPRPLTVSEAAGLLASLRTWRDRAMAGLMLYCGLRSCEVLALEVGDVDIGRGWIRVWGKGAKERAVPLDADLARVIHGYLLAERPESNSARLFLVAKGRGCHENRVSPKLVRYEIYSSTMGFDSGTMRQARSRPVSSSSFRCRSSLHARWRCCSGRGK